MKTLVFTVALNGYDSKWKTCIDSHKEYCSRMGYTHRLIDNVDDSVIDLHPKWRKIEYMKRFIEKKDFDVVALFDADLFVRDTCPSFGKFVKNSDAHIFCVMGCSNRPNSGMVVAKSTKPSLQFFTTMLKNRNFPVEKEHFVTNEGENGHFISLYSQQTNIFEILPNCWNNNKSINNTDYIRHFCGHIPKVTDDNIGDFL